MTYPQILGLSVTNNLRPKIEYFLTPAAAELGGRQPGGPPSSVGGGTVTTGNSGVVPYAPCDGAGLTREQLKDFMLYQPALIAYSLERRIRPRVCRLQENYIRFCYAPPYLMSLPDAKFNSWWVRLFARLFVRCLLPRVGMCACVFFLG